jgi:4-phospho-D-threonate 3-dehydrogenase / 4-phospho-D-erythronate 3-dehydrogenase
MARETKTLPTIGITIGDAAGIGPEVTLKALANPDLRSGCRVIVIGDLAHLRRLASEIDLPVILDEAADVEDDAVTVHDLKNLPSEFALGVDVNVTGKAAAENIEAAIALWRQGKIDAICTAPISKKAIAMGGYDFPGHTEFLAHLTDTKEVAMSFFGGGLRVVLLSTHLPLRAALDEVRQEKLSRLIKFAHGQFSRLLGKRMRLAVAGLNPHASEGGMFGTEEIDEIVPAVEECKAAGIDISGPFSPDTIFLRTAKGEFDACVALYHDQATIAVKSLAFGEAVNVTLGLPFIRTSVDHGTAYDIAGKGVADASSMSAAIRLGGELAKLSRKTA